jgi:hypothetical protein
MGGGGRGQFTANQGSEWTKSHHVAKEGFQVSRKGVQKQGKEFSRQRGITKGIVPCTSDIMPTLYISCRLCVCRANKELCLGYKLTMYARCKIRAFNFMDPPEW